MKNNYEEYDFLNYHCPRYEELPSKGIYMDSLITTLNKYLQPFQYPSDEKIITATMVNNYVKNKVIPAPINKKYYQRHIVYLMSIGILKNVLSISDIATLIRMQEEEYPIEIAYNFFCTEIENSLNVTFGARDFFHANNIAQEKTPLSEIIHSACLSFANNIYVKHNIYKK